MARFSRHTAVFAWFILSISLASAEDKQVKATVNGVADTLLGTITANVGLSGTSGKNDATFNYANDTIGKLDDCYEMRWFQFITFDDAPAAYGGKKPIPIVDPPSGGWDYQSTKGGADKEPFYENSGTGSYAYPNFSARHTQYKKSWTDDFPGIPDGDGKKTVWQTWLVARPIGVDQLCLLLGYEWEVGTKGTDKYGQFNKWIASSDADTNTMNTALTNGGFDKSKWPIMKDCNLECSAVPEPSTLLPLGLGTLGFLGALRRRSPVRK